MDLNTTYLSREESAYDMSAEEIATKIAKRISGLSPAVKPHFRPYIKQEGVYFTSTQGFVRVDMKKFYPDAKKGNTAFAVCNIHIPRDSGIAILVHGKVKVWFNKSFVFSSMGDEATAAEGYEVKLIDAAERITNIKDAWQTTVDAKEGTDNELIIETVCDGDGFCFDLNLSHPKNLTVWPKDYLIWARAESPLPELAGEENIAISKLYDNEKIAEENFIDKCEFAFPKLDDEGTDFDLSKIYKNGSIAFAYTEAVRSGKVVISAHAPVCIMKNGVKEAEINKGAKAIRVKSGDKLLIKCLRKNDKWGFSVDTKKCFGLPFVKMTEERKLTFLFCGTFYHNGLATKTAPEYEIKMNEPYRNEKGEWVYWRFYTEETYLRAYLDSCFYGQWFYATMLSLHALYITALSTDDEGYDKYFYEAMLQMAQYFKLMQYDEMVYTCPSFMPYSTETHYLDYIGTMGVNFVDAYLKSTDTVFEPIIERLRKGIEHDVMRFPNGVFYRQRTSTMWADDLYMSCPFLMRLAKYTGDHKYYDEAIRQLMGFAEKLYMPEEKIFSHIFFVDKETPNRIPWGRGNGWIAYAMTEVLMALPEEYKDREALLSLFKEFMEGVRAYQDESGLWHQVLNNPSTYLETSCTAMFMIGLIRGIENGWLDESYKEPLKKAWEGLKSLCIAKDGAIYNICMGSSCSMEEKYYVNIPTQVDDDHGTSVVLAAIDELLLMEDFN